MLTIYYCDDDALSIKKAQEVTEKYAQKNQIPLRFLDFSRAEDLLFYIEDYMHEVDLIFLDIFMGELNGMETAHKLREKGYKGEIIFISTSADYVFEAFEVDSFNYLLKGELSENKFLKVLDSVIQEVEDNSQELLLFSMGSDTLKIDRNQIHYFEIDRRVVTVYYDMDKSFEFYQSMDALSKDLLSKGFKRTHRAYLVNMNHIVSISKEDVLLKGGHRVPIGNTYYEDLLTAFNHFLESQWR